MDVFTAGGNFSGMPIWLMFSLVVTCMLANGKIRVLMTGLTLLEDLACISIGHFFPGTVTPLVGEAAEFYDLLQSFAIVGVFLAAMLIIYISTYDNQRRKLEEQSIELRNIMQTDALTGVFNRRAYYDEISAYNTSAQAKDLVLVAMDVNGLKKINDLLGHAAGDEYIRAAAKVISQAFGSYGHIFRTGGDEFMAVLHCASSEAYGFEEHLNACIAKTDSIWAEKMAIALGVVCCEEEGDVDFKEIEKLADKKMYENKAAYYKKNGIDRRK